MRQNADVHARVVGELLKVAGVSSDYAGLDESARVELLRLGRDSRLFQEKSVKDVVTAVLEEAGLDSGTQDWKTKGQHPERPISGNARCFNEASLPALIDLSSHRALIRGSLTAQVGHGGRFVPSYP